MTVRELIEQLGDFPDEMEVRFAYQSGDYWRTVVTANVREVSEGKVEYSEYHRMDALVKEDDKDVDDDSEAVDIDTGKKEVLHVVIME